MPLFASGFARRNRRTVRPARRPARSPFAGGGFEWLEERRLLAAFASTTPGILDVTLSASEALTVTSAGDWYDLTLASGTWMGSADYTAVSDTLLRIAPAGPTSYGTIRIANATDATGCSVTFGDSGTNAYSSSIAVTLSATPGVTTFNGATKFSGSAAVSITTERNIVFASGSSLTTVDGNLSLSANLQATAATFAAAGIEVNNATVQATGTGAVTVKGRAGSGTNISPRGVSVWGGGKILGGTGTGDANQLQVEGTGGTNASAYGVFVSGSRLGSGGSSVKVVGFGGGTGSAGSNYGVYVNNVGLITAGGTGAVTVEGTGGNPSGSGATNHGVFVTQSGTLITSGGGDVRIKGTGGNQAGGSGANNWGVIVNIGAVVRAGGTGAVSVQGTGGRSTGTGQNGVYVLGAGSAITSGDPGDPTVGGNVEVTGDGGGQTTAGNGVGVYVNAGVISARGAGTVKVTGTGGPGAGNSNVGVRSEASGGITSSGGAVTVNGTGGGRSGLAGASNYGLWLNSGGYVTAGGSGTVTVTGTGGPSTGAGNSGIYLSGGTAPNGSRITSGGGAVTITGIEGSGSSPLGIVLLTPASLTTAANGGSLTVLADSLDLQSGASVAAGLSGTATIGPRSGGVAMDLGLTTDTAGGPLALSAAELGRIGGGTLRFGSATAGTLTLSQPLTAPVGSNLTLTTAPSAGLIPSATGTDLTITGQTLSLGSGTPLKASIEGTAVDSGYQQLKVAGTVDLTGATLALSGSYTPQPGDVFTIVSATSLTGTFTGLAAGAVTTLNGVNLVVGYTSTAVTLTAPFPPTITSDPASTSVMAGEAASFSASGSGTPSPTVQWQVSVDGGSSWSDIPGATATTYRFTAAAADNGRSYRAAFTNPGGTTTTTAATLTLMTAPVITTQPTGGTYLPGTTTVLTAVAAGNPTPTVQWQVDPGTGWADVAGANATTLGIVVSTGMTPQRYRAVFSNAAGSATSDVATIQAAANVTGKIRAVRSGLTLNRTTGNFQGTITLTNTGGTPLAALSLLFSGLTAGVTLTNADGTLADGTPFLNTGPLAAGQSVTLKLSFRKPLATTAVNYTLMAYLKP